MLGNTITLNLGTIADPEEIILSKINQDQYSSEYRLKGTDREHVVLIRHAKEKNKLKGKEVERHNVTYTQNLFPTELAPLGETIQSSAVIRNAPDMPNATVETVGNAVAFFVSDNIGALVNWES